MNKQKKSTLYIVLSAIFFSTGGVFFKLIPWNGHSINSARCFIALVVLIVYSVITKRKIQINKTIILAAISISLSNISYAFSNKMTTAGNAVILEYSMPIFVIVLMFIMYKKKPTKQELLTCLCVATGVLLFFIDSYKMGYLIGDLIALFAGVSYALYFIINNKNDSDPLSSIMIAFLINTLFGFPSLLKENIAQTPRLAIIAIILLGLLQQGIAQILLSIGIKETNPIRVSLLLGLEPILNPILVAIVIGETLPPLSTIGAIIVLISITKHNIYDK